MRRSVLALIAWMFTAFGAVAQGYNPVITVNGDAITAYELSQRQKMLELFNTPGDVQEIAREQLIEERLKLQEITRVGMRLTDDALAREMEAFASRANLPYDQFLGILRQNGVAEESLRDFVRVGVTWRDYVRNRYGSTVSVTPADRRRALSAGAGAEIQVLLSEIIIPAPPQLANRAMAEAQRISRLRSAAAFSAAAREFSALPSAPNGGRLDWVPLSNFPPQLHPILSGLATGEVTPPLPIQGGIALFQLRGIREIERPDPVPAQIDYLTFSLPGGLSDATQAEAARIARRVDTCDDFYGIAHGLPADRLQRQSVAPSQIPSDIAQVMAALDDDEVTYGLTRNQGQTMLMVMLCRRIADPTVDLDSDDLEGAIASQQLDAQSQAILADLRARAVIR